MMRTVQGLAPLCISRVPAVSRSEEPWTLGTISSGMWLNLIIFQWLSMFIWGPSSWGCHHSHTTGLLEVPVVVVVLKPQTRQKDISWKSSEPDLPLEGLDQEMVAYCDPATQREVMDRSGMVTPHRSTRWAETAQKSRVKAVRRRIGIIIWIRRRWRLACRVLWRTSRL